MPTAKGVPRTHICRQVLGHTRRQQHATGDSWVMSEERSWQIPSIPIPPISASHSSTSDTPSPNCNFFLPFFNSFNSFLLKQLTIKNPTPIELKRSNLQLKTDQSLLILVVVEHGFIKISCLSVEPVGGQGRDWSDECEPPIGSPRGGPALDWHGSPERSQSEDEGRSRHAWHHRWSRVASLPARLCSHFSLSHGHHLRFSFCHCFLVMLVLLCSWFHDFYLIIDMGFG